MEHTAQTASTFKPGN